MVRPPVAATKGIYPSTVCSYVRLLRRLYSIVCEGLVALRADVEEDHTRLLAFGLVLEEHGAANAVGVRASVRQYRLRRTPHGDNSDIL